MQLKVNGPHMRNAQKNAGEDGDSSVTAYVRKLIEIDTAKRQGRFSCHVDALQIDEFLELAISAAGMGRVTIAGRGKKIGIWPCIGSIPIEPESEGSKPILEIAIQKAREMLHEDVEGEQ